MTSRGDLIVIKEREVEYMMDVLEVLDKELRQMEKTYDWFLSDTRPLLEEARGILKSLLEIEEDEPEEDDSDWEAEVERVFVELCIDRERAHDYWREDEDGEQQGSE